MLPEFAALERHRLDHEWTWDELARAMKRAGIEASARTLYHIIKRAHEDERPRDITLDKVRRYLEKVRANKRRAEARKARTQTRPETTTPASA